MEATSYVYFIGWKFDMWIQAWKLVHSLQVIYENWAASFYREKQALLTVELKSLTTKGRKKSLRLWCAFLAKYFSSGCETVRKKLLNLVQVALTKIHVPGNEAKIRQEMEFQSSEEHLFNFSWLLPDLASPLNVVQVKFSLEVLTAVRLGTTFPISKPAVSVLSQK